MKHSVFTLYVTIWRRRRLSVPAPNRSSEFQLDVAEFWCPVDELQVHYRLTRPVSGPRHAWIVFFFNSLPLSGKERCESERGPHTPALRSFCCKMLLFYWKARRELLICCFRSSQNEARGRECPDSVPHISRTNPALLICQFPCVLLPFVFCGKYWVICYKGITSFFKWDTVSTTDICALVDPVRCFETLRRIRGATTRLMWRVQRLGDSWTE